MRFWSPASFWAALVVFLVCIIASNGANITRVYIDSHNGNDNSSDCSVCEPCKSFTTAVKVISVAPTENIEIGLFPGAYKTLNASFGLPSVHSLLIFGVSSFPCHNASKTFASDEIELETDLKVLLNSSISKILLMNLVWKAPEDKTIISLDELHLRSFNLQNITLSPELHLNLSNSLAPIDIALQNSVFSLPLRISSVEHGPVNLNIDSSNFTSNFIIAGAIDRVQIENSRFLGSTLSFLPFEESKRAIVQVNRCHFINGSILQIYGANTTVHASAFAGRHDAHIEVNSIQVNESTSYVDARGNYWGHSSGPFSCCNPAGKGAFVHQVDFSSWCLDASCEALNEPIDASINYTLSGGYSTSWCHFNSYCPQDSDKVVASTGAMLAFGGILCGIFALWSYKRYKSVLAEERTPGSFSQSGFVTAQQLDYDALRNKTIMFTDIVTILISVLFSLVAILPTHLYPQERRTTLTEQTRGWYLAIAIYLIGTRVLRILCALWNFFIVRYGRPTYRTLLGNVIFSSMIVQATAILRFSSVINDASYTNGFLNYTSVEPFILPLGFLISYTKFVWIVWALAVASDLLLAAPIIYSSLRIIKKRDFAEAELLRKQLAHNPIATGSTSLRGSRIARSARIISWVAFASGMLFIGVVVSLGALITVNYVNDGQLPFISNINGLDRALVLTYLMGRLDVFFNCLLLSLAGWAVLRWRFYETALVWTYFAVSLGVAASCIEMGAFFTIHSIIGSMNGLAITAASVTVVALILMLTPTLLAGKLVGRMKQQLAPQITSSIYEQLEDTLS